MPSIATGKVSGPASIEGATVSFVEAFAAAASGSMQPIEDAAATTELKTSTGRDGDFRIEVPAGRYFVFVTPPEGDDVHLPGGTFSRESIHLAEGSTTILQINISEQPPEGGTFVGSSRCLQCHPGHASSTQTLHFLGLRRVTNAGSMPGALQDLAKFPNHDQSLTYFPDGNPQDNTGAGDAYGYRLTTGSGYAVLLGLDVTGHFQALESLDGSKVSERLYVEFSYGGEGRFHQQFMTRVDRTGAYTAVASDGSYQILPAEFRETEGDPDRGNEITEPVWVAYEAVRWSSPATDGGVAGSVPSPSQSFDNQCAGCHFTGMSLVVEMGGLIQATAVSDPGGAFDYDGDGNRDEINVGCESCHGAGSRHAADARGHIVQPRYLSPGRAGMICARCHVQGQGLGLLGNASVTGYPSKNTAVDAIEFFAPGDALADFYGKEDGKGLLPDFGSEGGYLRAVDLATDGAASWKDRTDGFGGEHNHTKAPNQEAFDHARSAHASNPFRMLTCFDCHSSHDREHPAQAVASFDNNVLCLDCHAGLGDYVEVTNEMVDEVAAGGSSPQELKEAINEHTVNKTFQLVGVAMNLGAAVYSNPAGDDKLGRCTTCHMTKTARAGSWVEDVDGFVIRGDISSHAFDNIAPKVSENMAADGSDVTPNSCVDCHRGVLRGSWPDYRAKP